MADELVELKTDLQWPRTPYPGLRPFRISDEADELLIFRGRDTHRDDVLERLDASQFVSVVGPSGCGKSSLVKVGVIPVLKAGLLTRAGYDWQTIEMRPGQDPLGNLAAALAELNGVTDDPAGMTLDEMIHLLATRRSALWVIVERMADRFQSVYRAAKARRVLLVLDQFEEIFSVSDPRAVDQFVALITQIFRNPHPRLFIVLTMRTDFISQCANFPGLAEILNKTQYITPVLRGRDLIDAIEQPAEAYWGEVDPRLVTAIVHDMGAGTSYDADHLPLMQHALLWLWHQAWPATGLAAPPNPGMTLAVDVPKVRLTLEQYRDHGRLHGILNHHAEAIFTRVTEGPGGERRAAIAEAMLRRLSERDASARYKRAPAYEDEVCDLAGCSPDELKAVTEPFEAGDASFVERRRHPGREAANPLLDLSHESLIRQWARLRVWADAEADKLAKFREFARTANVWDGQARKRRFLKTGWQLDDMRDWWHRNRPTSVWAGRYKLTEGEQDSLADALPLVQAFESASVRHRQRQVWLSITGGLLVGVVLAVAGAIWVQQRNQLLAATEAVLKNRYDAIAVYVRRNVKDHKPDQALQWALSILGESAASDKLPESEPLTYAALWNLHEMRIVRAENAVYSVDYSPDGKWLLAGVLGRPTLWDTGHYGQTPLPTPKNTPYWRTLWNPRGGQLLLTSSERSTVLVAVDASRPGAIAEGTTFNLGEPELGEGVKVGLGTFSGDGSRVLTGMMGTPLRVFSAGSGKLEAQAISGLEGFSFAANVDASLAAVASPVAGVDIYSIDGKSISWLATVQSPRPRNDPACANLVRALAFHPKIPQLLVSASACGVVASDARTGRSLYRFGGDRHTPVTWIAFSNDGTRFVTGADDGIIRLYNLPTGDPPGADQTGSLIHPAAVLGRHESTVFGLRFSPDDRSIVSGSRDGTVRVWSVLPALDENARLGSRSELIDFARSHLPEGIAKLDPCLLGEKECFESSTGSE